MYTNIAQISHSCVHCTHVYTNCTFPQDRDQVANHLYTYIYNIYIVLIPRTRPLKYVHCTVPPGSWLVSKLYMYKCKTRQASEICTKIVLSPQDRDRLANQTAYNVSKILDNILKDYDNSLRPDFGGNYILWCVGISITNISSSRSLTIPSMSLWSVTTAAQLSTFI